MAERIFKYSFPQPGTYKIPTSAQILDVQEKHGVVTLWVRAIIDADQRNIYVLFTGDPIPQEEWSLGVDHVKTLQIGAYVWHVFEERA